MRLFPVRKVLSELLRTLPLRLSLSLLITVLLWAGVSESSAQSFFEEELRFSSGEITLDGTVLVPPGPGPHPALVLVHGAGLGLREDYRPVADAFTEHGFVTLIYDKRADGYSASPIGPRSYELLARDVVSAVHSLQHRDDVDAKAVGVWGLSEGGWVAPLAASRSPEIAFVITVAGGGIGPARQTAWSVQGALMRQGVTSRGVLRALADRVYSMLVAVEIFPEGLFNPVPVLAQMQQPVLALWGAEDRLMPPGASAELMYRALQASGHPSYTLRIVPEADHEVTVVSTAGSPSFAPGYIETMVAWARRVVAGHSPDPSVDSAPPGEAPVPEVTEPALVWQGAAQVWVFGAIQLLVIGSAFRARLRTGSPKRERDGCRWLARALGVLLFLITWGVYGAAGFVAMTAGEAVGPVVVGRPLFWLVLQLMAVAAVVATFALLVVWIGGRGAGMRSTVLPFVAGVLFVPWAVWWQLLSL